MGFLSSLSGVMGGGAQSSGGSSSQSGFALLPQSIQDAFSNYGTAVNKQVQNPNLTSMFTPLGQTAGETQAYSAINGGFTPTQQSLTNDINMQMNPYDNSVINTINNQANGDYSILKQNASQAGQFGSNRQNLGANDIDQQRLNQIGTFKQNEYNTALNNALTTLPSLRAGDATLQLGAGQAQRQLAGQTAQAPIAGLGAVGGLLGALPQSGGSVGNSSQQSSSSQSGTGGNLISTAASLYSLFSDIRLKDNIKPLGQENGHNIYEFTYKGDSKKFIGVMAQEVEKIDPEAVEEISGYKAVNYDRIGVKFREAV